MVEQLKEMGFPESQVVAALRAANDDPNVAIEFLFSGNIPASTPSSSSLPSSASEGLGLMQAGGEGGRGGGGEGGERMGGQPNQLAVAQLLSHPEMENVSADGGRIGQGGREGREAKEGGREGREG